MQKLTGRHTSTETGRSDAGKLRATGMSGVPVFKRQDVDKGVWPRKRTRWARQASDHTEGRVTLQGIMAQGTVHLFAQGLPSAT